MITHQYMLLPGLLCCVLKCYDSSTILAYITSLNKRAKMSQNMPVKKGTLVMTLRQQLKSLILTPDLIEIFTCLNKKIT